MSTVPREYDEAVTWLADRIAAWSANPELLGLTLAETAALSTALSEATSARSTAFQLRLDSKDATVAYHESAGSVQVLTRQAVAKIRAAAKASPTPGAIYSAASIPPPADRTPSAAPGMPEGFVLSLRPDGALVFNFRCENPSNVSVTYKVERRAGAQGPFQFLENAKKRSFTDENPPVNNGILVYKVTAQTSTKDGVAAILMVQFGANNQATIVSQGPEVSTKAS